MTNTEISTARSIVSRRLALLSSLGENARNTISWREACAESAELERRIAFTNWRAAGCPTYRGRITK